MDLPQLSWIAGQAEAISTGRPHGLAARVRTAADHPQGLFQVAANADRLAWSLSIPR